MLSCHAQRLEVELKQSYATKNFTLRDGLLEIEKNYRDFIHQSEDVEVCGKIYSLCTNMWEVLFIFGGLPLSSILNPY